MNVSIEIIEPGGPYHNFWLLREEECPYHETDRYLGRTDAPIRIPDDLMNYIGSFFREVPVISPGHRKQIPSRGLHLYGPNIINREGARLFRQICENWAELFSQGPSPLYLNAGEVGTVGDEGIIINVRQRQMRIDREEIVATFHLFAEWGALAESGEKYILYHGV